MNHIDQTSALLAERIAELPPQQAECPPELLRLYTLLVLTTGTGTTLENVHDAWAIWRAETRPDHKDLVWFSQLSQETQEWDRPYMNAIREVAQELS